MSDDRHDSKTVKHTPVRLDAASARILRSLGEAAIRLADGQPLDDTAVAAVHPNEESRVSAPATLLTVTEACDRLRISRWSFYRLLHARQLNTVTIGRRRLIPASEVDKLVATLQEGAAV